MGTIGQTVAHLAADVRMLRQQLAETEQARQTLEVGLREAIALNGTITLLWLNAAGKLRAIGAADALAAEVRDNGECNGKGNLDHGG